MASQTFYTGNEAEEKATKTWNYAANGIDIKTTTYFTYVADRLSVSEPCRYMDGTVLKSQTYYTGDESEEKADYTYNYDYAGAVIRTTTEFSYRLDCSLERSDTYKDKDGTVVKSYTLYTGIESEDKASQTFTYGTVAGAWVVKT